MKRYISSIFLVFICCSSFSSDSISGISKPRMNELQLSIVLGGSSNTHGKYHTMGYSRLFNLEEKSYLGFYLGLGYLPPKSKQLFAHKIGFDGYKFYAYTGRFQFVQMVQNFGLYSAIEYTFLTHNEDLYYANEHQFMIKMGVEFLFFKNHLSLRPQIGLGRSRLQDPYDPTYFQENALTFGFDIGFCF